MVDSSLYWVTSFDPLTLEGIVLRPKRQIVSQGSIRPLSLACKRHFCPFGENVKDLVLHDQTELKPETCAESLNDAQPKRYSFSLNATFSRTVPLTLSRVLSSFVSTERHNGRAETERSPPGKQRGRTMLFLKRHLFEKAGHSLECFERLCRGYVRL